MVKSIIKRIIVGVGIALVLMALKDGGLIANAYALTTEQSEVDFISYNIPNYNNGAIQTASYSNLQDFEVSGYINMPFKGVYAKNYNNNNYGFFRFRFQNANLSSMSFSNDILNKKISMSFLIYANMQSQQSIPVRVWLGDSTGRIYACDSNSSFNLRASANTATNNVIGMLVPVTCDNILLSNKNFNVYVGDQLFPLGSGTTDNLIGISRITAWNVSDQEATINAINENTQATEDVNNSINDETNADTGGFLEDIGQDYSNNPVSDLITMPITFLQRLNNNANGSCITWNLGSLLGTNLTMPCINLQNILGSWLYNLIDMAICLFLAYNIGLMCITIWNNMTSLKDDFDDMYSPRHAYNGKHGGGS